MSKSPDTSNALGATLLVTLGTVEIRRNEAYSGPVPRASLRRSLLEAALWCMSRADAEDPRASLRTEALRPYLFNDSRERTLHDVVFARHQSLNNAGRIVLRGGRSDDLIGVAEAGLAAAVEVVARGRLLVWNRDDTIDDGAGEAETGGYLDVSDMPPWDTWVAYEGSGCLISWVPPVFVPSVERAIAVNAYQALYWLRGTTLRFARLLEEDGLLV